jgi:hypothetical protein
MDAATWSTIVKALGELTLTGFLFANWWLERAERIQLQTAYNAHLQGDIDKLDDTLTEAVRAKN